MGEFIRATGETLWEILGNFILLIVDVIKILGNGITIGLGSLVAFIFLVTGGQDDAMNVLLILMTVDYLSGVIKAFITCTANSKAGIIGILKKVMIILIIVLAYQLDILFDGKLAIKTLAVGVFISNEGLSILENASICGIPIPEKLKKVLTQYQEYKKK
ncbi:phage holin family protein [Fusobacterium mortiferum]|uniref:Holin n=1 Tax=Fusobacterium mortiferum ATCC 9817 TaxID=469616 RepID=A0ABM6TVX3_FUSMR|nr:phage holin family protein [Fusobacterium mortiferum]AVQ18737.1 holin [Fusobacterium mortiferum ATCC 9817]EEO34980.2 toxin secretion/phage lysis holin [Fusobacterium mortiferum ATCC 9817]